MFVKCGRSNYVFLNSANLICRGTDISKYFRESLGIRDNEIRLYLEVVSCLVLRYKARYDSISQCWPEAKCLESFLIKILIFFIILLKT